ncbi:helix-turn-helix transcriptional regulator [Cryptosporangium phraense]|uniref:GAF domain-containing protein n=1 Tax=Cryptosporangium phraense TaxID=2593070 RepID=A0A545AXG4_9ACTN|nr:LuxR C-terminal-related transcriptional regulator [Cryptosporangium phraense]TQS46014.1 GAF domain-containing protein [Cryptosporangium phraense]
MTSEHAAVRGALLRLRRSTGLPVAFGGLLVPGGLRLTEFTGTTTAGLQNLLVTDGNGLGGRVLATSRPSSVADYAADTRITHDYDRPVVGEGLRAIAAVPAVVGGKALAVLYGGIREPFALGPRVVDAMAAVAAEAAVELAVQREVERRLETLETAALTRAARERPSAPEWDDVREADAELRAISREVDDPELRRRLLDVSRRLTVGRARSGVTLSGREVDVLALVAVGCTNAEAARRLGLGAETVKSYLRSAGRKLGTHTRTATVAAARRGGLLL